MKFFKNQRGASMLEAALAMPVLIGVSLLVVDLGMGITDDTYARQAAYEGARLLATCGGNQSDAESLIEAMMPMVGTEKIKPSVIAFDTFTSGSTTLIKVDLDIPQERKHASWIMGAPASEDKKIRDNIPYPCSQDCDNAFCS